MIFVSFRNLFGSLWLLKADERSLVGGFHIFLGRFLLHLALLFGCLDSRVAILKCEKSSQFLFALIKEIIARFIEQMLAQVMEFLVLPSIHTLYLIDQVQLL